MSRVKRTSIRRTRKKNLRRRTKGFFGGRRRYRQARAAALKADQQAFVGRKLRKRQFRRLWIQRISAALKAHDLSYSRFIHGLKLAEVEVNRKMLSELAIHEPEVFASFVEKARRALP